MLSQALGGTMNPGSVLGAGAGATKILHDSSPELPQASGFSVVRGDRRADLTQ